MKRHLVLLVLVLSCHFTSVRAYHGFLRDLLKPFMKCADENDVPRDKSLMGNLNNDIATLRLGFGQIVNCINDKLPVFRTSDDTAEWYIGHVFDINNHYKVRHLEHNLTNSRAYNFTCLNSDSDHYKREVCLNSSNVALNKTMEIAHKHNLSNELILRIICNGGKFMRPGNCMTVGDECTTGVSDFLQHVLFRILTGTHCESTRTTVTPSPTLAPYTRKIPIYIDNVEDSAFFACGRVIFNDTLEELFPPSESSVATVPNNTVAKQSMQTFCVKHREYAQCVTSRIMGRNNLIDHLTGNVINAYNLEKAFNLYCENQDLILSQYECTYNAVSGGTCFGGVYDLLETGVRSFQRMPITQVCRKLKSAVNCRLSTQLNQCSPQFVSVLQEFYNTIFGDQCYAGQFRPNAMTDIPTCFANYTLGLQGRISTNESNVMNSITKEMEYICEKEIDGMADCMYRVFSNPKKPQDRLMSKVFAAPNIKPLARRSCALVPALKPNLGCIAIGFGALASQPNKCLASFQETMASTMINGTQGMGDIDTVANLMCRLIGSLKPCLMPVFTSCDQSLGNSIGTLYDDMMAACNNPNYRLKDTTDGKSSSSKLSHTLAFILVNLFFVFQ